MRRARILRSFIHMLEREGIFKFNLDDFESRLRVQKYVFLAKEFGLDLGYEYNMYMRGPYSPELAQNYYNLPEEGAPLPEGFRKEDFLDLVRGKDAEWLEVAATLTSLWRRYHDREWALRRTGELKPWISKRKIRRVWRDLEEVGIVD